MRFARRKAPRRASGGQALVEFSIIIVLFFGILMILLDGGRVMYAQETISQAAREGVRAGEVGQSWTQAKYDVIRDRVKGAAPGLALADGDITGAPGSCPVADAADPSTCFYPGSLVAGEPTAKVVVYVTTTVDLVTPLSAIWGSAVTLTSYSEGYIQCSGCDSEPAPTP